MIFLCNSREDAWRIIELIRSAHTGRIFNYVINDSFGRVFLIIDGNLEAITDGFIERNELHKVFSILDGDDLFFVTDQTLVPELRIGKRLYDPQDHKVSVIAGPCAIESYESLYETAMALKKEGVSVFRAMPGKPRTSPYNFQGVGDIGWEYLHRIKEDTGLPVLGEVLCQEDIDLALEYDIDLIQIGTRNMQNYDLLKRAARSRIPTILKKGMWCTNEQLLKAAEYFYVYGSGNVILAERGIQTHETGTRNTFDVSSILTLKEKTCLPVLADASHGTGVREFVTPVNCAAVLMGADLVEVEVHMDPDSTIKPGDYYQMLDIGQYRELLKELAGVMALVGKRFDFES
ncbi:MAG: N-acetylneuraminate synthase family protein [Blautia sp.]|nr:N-acetylneuraminate synthase family protein [Blautia sp.]